MKENQKGETKTQIIQRNILEGRKVALVSNEKITTLVRVSYNNSDTDGTKKWRLIIDNDEYYTSEVKMTSPIRTLSEKFDGVEEKHYIVCDSSGVIFENNIANIY